MIFFSWLLKSLRKREAESWYNGYDISYIRGFRCAPTCLWVSCVTLLPLTSIIRSETFSPAASAGVPTSTFPIKCPVTMTTRMIFIFYLLKLDRKKDDWHVKNFSHTIPFLIGKKMETESSFRSPFDYVTKPRCWSRTCILSIKKFHEFHTLKYTTRLWLPQ